MVREEAGNIISLLRDHIDKEDNILFMMANVHLGGGQNRRILELFHGIEQREARQTPAR
jgi:hemerythrin-like domain-containing protein